jgi:molybdate transport system regulatory protein
LSWQCKSKLWMEKDGRKVFGDGPWDILQRVKRTGSLRQAAVEINMSYSQAWRLIRMLERNLGFPLLKRKAGGPGGGYSSLTPEAARLTAAYGNFRRETGQSIDALFKRYFHRDPDQ